MTTRLDELTSDEFYDVARYLYPDLPREEYDAMWASFVEWKREVESCGGHA